MLQVGMLALGELKVNFQYDSSTAHQRLLEAVKHHLPEQTDEVFAGEKDKSSVPSFNNNQLAYQVIV